MAEELAVVVAYRVCQADVQGLGQMGRLVLEPVFGIAICWALARVFISLSPVSVSCLLGSEACIWGLGLGLGHGRLVCSRAADDYNSGGSRSSSNNKSCTSTVQNKIQDHAIQPHRPNTRTTNLP